MLKLNSIPASVFDAKQVQDEKIRVNGKEISRADTVVIGRAILNEHVGTTLNQRPDKKGDQYISKLNGLDTDYATLEKQHRESKLLFCAAMANRAIGLSAPTSFEEVVNNGATYARNATFLATMAAIDRDVISPMFFTVFDEVAGGLLQMHDVAWGQTKEFTVRSNDVVIFEDGSLGSNHSTTKNYLYAKSITSNPRPHTANLTLKWYQDIVNGDAGYYYAALVRGHINKVYALLMQGLSAAIGTPGTANAYIPQGLTAATYTSANWFQITDLLAAANNVTVNDLVAIGKRSALSAITPYDGASGAMLGFQYGLGKEWFGRGYIANVGGVDLIPVSPVIVPGTQNSTLDTIDTGNNIYILAKGLERPMVGTRFTGSPIIITATPGGDFEHSQGTADFTIDINCTAFFDIKPLFASKVAVMMSVYPS